MNDLRINSALISVFSKQGIEPIVEELSKNDVKIYSTGGTYKYISELGYNVTEVENVTNYPSIFGGRVKTLHPKIFGGILYRRDNKNDIEEKEKFDIPSIDLVIVDLYPFEETVKNSKSESEIIEKIDIGGIALIRAAAKNFKNLGDIIVLGTAHPYKFSDTVKKAIGKNLDSPEHLNLNMDKKEKFDIIGNSNSEVKNYILGKIQ